MTTILGLGPSAPGNSPFSSFDKGRRIGQRPAGPGHPHRAEAAELRHHRHAQRPSSVAAVPASGPPGPEADRGTADVRPDDDTAGYLYLIASLDPEVQSGAKDVRQKMSELHAAFARTSDISSGQAASVSIEAQTAAAAGSSVSWNGTSAAIEIEAGISVHASLSAQFSTGNGTAVSVSAEVDMSISMSMRAEVSMQASPAPQQQADPLVLDLDRDGRISVGRVEDGELFDINGDGIVDRTAFVSGGDGFLALDRSGNGKIDDGNELFGDQHGAVNGFEELAKYDENGDGAIDVQDAVYAQLGALTRSGDGQLSFTSLQMLGVSAVSLAYRQTEEQLGGGSFISQRGSFASDAGNGDAVDVMLAYTQA